MALSFRVEGRVDRSVLSSVFGGVDLASAILPEEVVTVHHITLFQGVGNFVNDLI